MQTISPRDFTGQRAWEALPIATLSGSTSVRLHWTDQPYRWHVNDGHEVFVVLDGVVLARAGDDPAQSVEVLISGSTPPARSWWPPSTPVSITAIFTPLPVDCFQASRTP